MRTNARNTLLSYAQQIGRILLLGSFFLGPSCLSGQIVWQENFSTYPDGTQNTAMWSTNFNDCDDADVNMGNNFWGVQGGEFRINDIEGFNCSGGGGDNANEFITDPIDISANDCVDISIDIGGSGGLECDFPGGPNFTADNSHDQLVVEYSVNGGAWTQLIYVCGDVGLPTTGTATNIQGNSLRIRVLAGNKANAENYTFDNIVVENASSTPNLSSFGPFCSSDASTPLPTTQDGIMGTWSGSGVIGGVTFNPSTASVGSNTLTFTPNPGQCANTNTTSVTVNAGPDVDDIPNQTACGFYTLPVITGTNLSGSAAYYTSPSGTGVQLNPGQNITAATTTTLFIFDTNGGCTDEEQFNITIIPRPDVNDLADQTVCGSYILPNITGTNLNGNEAYFTGSGRTGTQFNPGQTITTTTTLYIHGGTGGCDDEEQVLITITPAPQVNDQANTSACGSYTLPAITGTNLTGNEAYFTGSGGTGTQFNPGQTINNTITLFIYDDAGTCDDEETVTITITAPPDINDLANQSACGSYTLPAITGTNLAGNEAYFTGSNGTGTQFNPGQTINSNITLFIYGGTGACSDEETVSITITPAPDVDDQANTSACGSYTLPAITGTNLTGSEAYYTQTNGGGASFSPGQTINSTITLFIYDGSGSCSDEEAVTITITDPPNIDDIPNQTVCGSYTLPNITGTNLSGNEAYYTGTGGSGNQFNPGQVISANTTLFIYGGSGSCTDEEQFSITFTSPPNVLDLPNQTACGSYTLPPINGINLTGNQAYYTGPNGTGTQFNPGQAITSSMSLFIYDGTAPCDDQEQFTITITPGPDITDIPTQNVCGSYTLPVITGSNLSGNEAYYTASGGNGTRYETGDAITTSITLFIYGGTASCNDEELFSINVSPLPQIDDIGDPTACGSYTLPAITGTNLSGNEAYYTSSGGLGTALAEGEVITTSTTIFIYDGDPGCNDQVQVDITINPPIVIDDLADQTACESYTLPNITGTNLTGNEAYYTQSGGQGTQLNPGEAITTTTTLFIYDGVAGCEDEEQVTITITPEPNVDDLADQTVCASFTLPNISGTNLTGNEAYFTQTGGQGIQLNPGEIITTTTTLFIYDGVAGCEDEEQVTITITLQPDVDDLADQTACASFTLPNITGTNLTGSEAYFTETGGQGTQLNPGEIITTTTTLFIYDGVAGCEDQEQVTITITPQPDVDDLADQTACASFTLPNITGTNLTGNEAYFTETGGQGTQLNPGEIITTTTTLFIYDGVPSCEDEEQVTITVTPQPDVDDLADQTACASFTLPNITGTNLTGSEAYFTETGGQGTQLNPGEIITTTTTLFIYDGVAGCEDEEQVTITITPQPDVDDLADQTACASFTLPNITGTNLTGSEAYFTETGGQGTQLNPGEIITTTTTLFIYDGVPGCEDEEQATITITPQPDVDDLADQTVCASFTLPNITGTNLTGSEAYFTETGGQGTQLNPGEIITTTNTLFIYDGVAGCEDEEQVTITVTPQADVDDLADQTACTSFTLPNITGTNLTGSEAYFTETGGQGTQLNPGEIITTTTTLFIYDGVAGCEDEEQVTITITPQPDVDDLADQTACASFTLPNITGTNLTGNEAYFTQIGGQGTQLNPGEIITTTTTLFIYDGVAGCEDEEQVSITITPQPNVDDLPNQTACASFTLPNITGTNLTGSEAYFTETGGQGTQLNPGEIITTTTTLFIYIYDGVPGCEDEEQATITITPQPDVDDLADQTACASFTLPNITGTNLTGSEAYFTENGGQGTQLNPGEIITTTTTLFIYDGVPGCEDEEQVTITVTPQADVDDLADQTVCTSFILPNITGTNLSGNEAYFTQSGGQGTRLLPGETISATTTLFIYDGVSGCEDEEEFTIAIAGQPSLDPIDDVNRCGSFTLPEITGSSLSGNQAYFTAANGAGTRFTAGEVISTTTTLFAFDGAAGCEDEVSFTITITEGPDITPLDEQIACSSFELPAIVGTNLTGNEAYFTGSGGSGTRFEVGDVINTSQTLFIYDGTAGCEDEEAFSLTINPAPQIDDIPNQVVCESFVLPEITGVNLSGNEAYFDEVNGNGNSFQAGDIITSDQVLFIWDNSNGCNNQQVFEIIVNEAPDVLLLPTPVSCAGGNDGLITPTILAGTAPFTYDWNFDQYDGQESLQDLSAGLYSLILSDANNCSITASVTLSEPPAIDLSCQENSPVSSLGGNDGIADINLTGGAAPYVLTWDNGTTTASENIDQEGLLQLSDLGAGNYSVVLIDNNGCEANCTFTITDPACGLTVSATATDATCHDSNDGSILVELTGGQAPFSFSWSDPSLDGTQSPTGLAGGDYILTVTDANGCEVISSASVAAPAALSLTGLTTRPVSAAGQNDGGLTVNYQGGTAPYQISWSGALFGSLAAPSSGVFSLDIFPEGDYTLTLTDDNGCQTSLDFSIPGVNCNLSISLQGEDLNCFEDRSGRISLSIVGGISPLDIDWNIDSLDGLRTPQDLTAGDYEVVVTDANGCSATETISLQEPTALSISCSPEVEASAPGAVDGRLNVDVSGGTPNYTIDWGNGSMSGSDNLFIAGTAEIDSLAGGEYEIFVIDDNGCMETCQVVVTEACPTSEHTIGLSLCAGDSLIVNGTTYNAANPSGQEVLANANVLGCDSIITIDLQFLPEATATIDQELCQGESLTIGNTVFDVNNPSGTAVLPNASPDGCDSLISVNLTFQAAPVFALEGAGTVCPGEAASLTFRASNFTAPVNIILSDGTGELIPVSNLTDGSTFEVNPMVTTTYSIMDTDANGSLCPPVIDGAVTINVTELIVDLEASDFNGFQLSCPDAMDGRIDVSIQGGTSPYTYNWSNGATTESLQNLEAGLYELTVTDATGCEAISEVLLSAPTAIEATLAVIPPGCNEQAGLIRIESITGGSGPFSIRLDGNAAQAITGIPFELSSLTPGTYQLEITDANACSFSSEVEVPNEESLLLDLGEDITIGLGVTATISAISNFTIDKFIWEPNDSIIALGNNEFSVSPMHTTVYTFTAFDAAGCSVSDQITVIVDRTVDLFRPTAFSPNNDGVNDVFQVFAGSSVVNINSFLVFDRWGNTLYEGYDVAPNDPSLGWDGTYRGQPMNTGVYVYYVEVTFVDGRKEVFKGDVALVR